MEINPYKSEPLVIHPAENPNWQPTENPVEVEGLRSPTEVLLEMREEGF